MLSRAKWQAVSSRLGALQSSWGGGHPIICSREHFRGSGQVRICSREQIVAGGTWGWLTASARDHGSGRPIVRSRLGIRAFFGRPSRPSVGCPRFGKTPRSQQRVRSLILGRAGVPSMRSTWEPRRVDAQRRFEAPCSRRACGKAGSATEASTPRSALQWRARHEAWPLRR